MLFPMYSKCWCVHSLLLTPLIQLYYLLGTLHIQGADATIYIPFTLSLDLYPYNHSYLLFFSNNYFANVETYNGLCSIPCKWQASNKAILHSVPATNPYCSHKIHVDNFMLIKIKYKYSVTQLFYLHFKELMPSSWKTQI